VQQICDAIHVANIACDRNILSPDLRPENIAEIYLSRSYMLLTAILTHKAAQQAAREFDGSCFRQEHIE
jgi:hypothetical protein